MKFYSFAQGTVVRSFRYTVGKSHSLVMALANPTIWFSILKQSRLRTTSVLSFRP